MAKYDIIYIFLVSCIGLSVAFYSSYIPPEITPPNGTCIIESPLVIKSLMSNKFVNGKNTLIMIKGMKNSFYKWWSADAGIGWFVLRNIRNGMKLLDVDGGCENAKPGSKLILWTRDEAEDNNKFVFNSDGTIQSLCSKDLIVKVDGNSLVLAHIDDTSASTDDIRFVFRDW